MKKTIGKLKTKKIKTDKTKKLLDRIVVTFLILIVLIIVTIFTSEYTSKYTEDIDREFSILEIQSERINSQIKDVQTKSRSAKKYIQIYNSLSENQKQTEGIKLNEIKDLFAKLTQKYDFKNVKLNAEAPRELSGIFAKDNITTSTILIVITFESLLDTYIYDFIGEISKTLPGFTIIEQISIDRTKNITDSYLLELSKSRGEKNLPLNFQMKIRLYSINKTEIL